MEQENQTPQLTVSSVNSVSLTLGIISVVIGVFGLMAGWIPVLGLAAIPAASIGLLLSIAGIVFAALKKFRSIELPILGCLMCITAISLSLFSSYQAAKLANQVMAQAAKDSQEKAAAEAATKRELDEKVRAQTVAQTQAELKTLQSGLLELEATANSDQTNLTSVQAGYDAFMLEKPYLTNEVYLNLTHRIANTKREIEVNAQTAASARSGAYATKPTYGGGGSALSQQELAKQQAITYQNAQSQAPILAQNLRVLNQQMDELMVQMTKFQNDRLKAASQAADSSSKKLERTKARIEYLNGSLMAQTSN